MAIGLGLGGRYLVKNYTNGIHNDLEDQAFNSPSDAIALATEKSIGMANSAEVIDQYLRKVVNKFQNGEESPIL